MSPVSSTGVFADSHTARSVVAFALVGATAAAVHLIVVASTVPLGIHPLAANVLGFTVAFGFSYAGHRRWSFATSRSVRPRALYRFFVVALAGFLLNESLYAALLWTTSLDYRVALIIVLGLVAGSTYLASRYWAFACETR